MIHITRGLPTNSGQALNLLQRRNILAQLFDDLVASGQLGILLLERCLESTCRRSQLLKLCSHIRLSVSPFNATIPLHIFGHCMILVCGGKSKICASADTVFLRLERCRLVSGLPERFGVSFRTAMWHGFQLCSKTFARCGNEEAVRCDIRQIVRQMWH